MSGSQKVSKSKHEQTPIPDEWRETLVRIVEQLKAANFQLIGVPQVCPLTPEDGRRIAGNLQAYGAQLVSLPDAAWSTSVCQWMSGYWDLLVDLYTLEECASDLVLAVRVRENLLGFEFCVQSLHVP
jgi:hypothetical protein